MRRVLSCWTLIGVIAFPFGNALAQDRPLTLGPGARIRITAPDLGIEKQEVRFGTLRGDTLVVVADSTLTLPLASVVRLDAYQGQRSNAWAGAGIGLVVGVGAGVAIALMVRDEDCFCTKGEVAAAGGAIGAAAGILIGSSIGAVIKTDRWQEVTPDQLRVIVVPRPGGLALGVSVAF